MSDQKGWIGVDLDGTLAHYDGWKGVGHIGEPILLMVRPIHLWLAEGFEVRIMTARVWPEFLEGCMGDGNNSSRIKAWCLKHIGQELPVTCCKDFSMIELWDDRAVRVEINTGKVIAEPWVNQSREKVASTL